MTSGYGVRVPICQRVDVRILTRESFGLINADFIETSVLGLYEGPDLKILS